MTCLAFVTVSSSQQEGSFQVTSRLMFLCLSTKMCAVFRKRGLPSSYDGQLRAMVIACFVLEAIGALGQKTNTT